MKSRSMLQIIALTGVLAISHASENWTGDGGKGTSITIDAPKASGLAENQSHLPTVVQAEFVSNFSSYSAISVLDWERLGEIYAKLGSGIFGGDNTEAAMQDLGQLATTTYFMTGSIAKAGTSYHLQVNIIKTADKMTAASYSGTFSYWDLDNRTGIRKASLELLKKMGVTLTAKAQGELAGAATASQINGQTAFAKGITAQRRGNEVEALSYYFQAATFDPSLKEAVSRSSTLNANIASGSMGNNVRNDIQWRKQWVDRLTETEQFFDNFHKMESMPYTLFYSKDINQGKINYQNETVALSIETYLYGSDVWTISIERALQAVYDGLNATKRKDDWGLDRWPQRGVTDLNAFERRRNNFSVVFELLNNQNKVIGRQALQSSGSWGLNWSGRPRVEISGADRKTLNFQDVNANDITDNLTIRVASVNDTDAETAAINGVLQIRAIAKSEADLYDSFRFSRGEVHGFTNRYAENAKELVIPNTIWGDQVISIGEKAFEDSKLTSVTIPNTVTSIGENAFANNQLANVDIPNGVHTIGKGAFEKNKLTNVVIPNSVRRIGEKAFAYSYTTKYHEGNQVIDKQFNKITQITIGEKVSHSQISNYPNSLSSFDLVYQKNNFRAGTYIYRDGFRGWEKVIETEEEKIEMQTTWHWAPAFGIGMPVMMNTIDTLYSSLGFQFFANVEFFKPSFSFFRLGLNFDLGIIGAGNMKDALKQKYPDLDSADGGAAFAKIGAFVKLYPADFIYLSGGANYGGFGGISGKSAGESVEIGGTSGVIFPIGVGLAFGSDGAFIIDAQYNIAMLKNGTGGYWSFMLGGKLGRKRFD